MEGARIHFTFTESEWGYVRELPRNTRDAIIEAFEGSVNGMKETAVVVGRTVKHTGRKLADIRQ